MEKCYRNDPHNRVKKYAKLVTWFANTSLGKDYLSGRGVIVPKNIALLLPNGYIAQKGKREYQMLVTIDSFHMQKKLDRGLQIIDAFAGYLSHFDEAKDIFMWGLGLRSSSFLPPIIKQFHFVTETYTPNASNVDGRVGRAVTAAETWANKHDLTGDTAQTASGTGPQINASATTNTWDELFRRPVPADTSALPDSAVIAATSRVRLFVNTKTTTLASQSIRLVATTAPVTLTALANGDYEVAKWPGVGQAADITLAAITTSAFNDFTLNGTGISGISKTGVTRDGFQIVADAANLEPTWSSLAVAAVTVDAHNGVNPTQYVIDYDVEEDTGGVFLLS